MKENNVMAIETSQLTLRSNSEFSASNAHDTERLYAATLAARFCLWAAVKVVSRAYTDPYLEALTPYLKDYNAENYQLLKRISH